MFLWTFSRYFYQGLVEIFERNINSMTNLRMTLGNLTKSFVLNIRPLGLLKSKEYLLTKK